jgi:hypothetical protein
MDVFAKIIEIEGQQALFRLKPSDAPNDTKFGDKMGETS